MAGALDVRTCVAEVETGDVDEAEADDGKGCGGVLTTRGGRPSATSWENAGDLGRLFQSSPAMLAM